MFRLLSPDLTAKSIALAKMLFRRNQLSRIIGNSTGAGGPRDWELPRSQASSGADGTGGASGNPHRTEIFHKRI
jgi:hypothetical protein